MSGDAAPEAETSPAFTVARVRAGALLHREWDVAVVGAGVGGLVAAAALAGQGLSVLVLEQHYRPGGFTQTFRRRRFEFDVGVHYVGDVLDGRAPVRRLFDSLTDGALRWSALPDVYDRLSLDDSHVALGGGVEQIRAAALAHAPDERAAIDRWFEELTRCAKMAPGFFAGRPPGLDRRRDRHPYFRWADATTHEMARHLGCSARLEQLLTARHGNYGEPPATSSFAIHAASMEHYYRGAGYPVGGGSAIAETLARSLNRRGGAVVVRAPVAAIRVRDHAAVGVRLEDGTEVDAARVVSDAGAWATFARLLPIEAPGVGQALEAVEAIGPSASHIALYLGLDGAPPNHGLDGANLWVASEDPRFALANADSWIAGDAARPSGMFVSVTSANDPTWRQRRGERTAIVASVLAPHAPFARWAHTPKKQRPAEYAQLKARLESEMRALLVQRVPALGRGIEHSELSTPLSTAHFTGHRQGEIYGLAHTPLRLRRGPAAETAIEGLALAGQDAWLCGVGGAAFGGLAAASALLRRDLMAELLLRRR